MKHALTIAVRWLPTFDYRRLALWLMVLLVPGGVLLLPLLVADMRRRRVSQPSVENQSTAAAPRLAA